MKPVFADTSFYLALFNPRDENHKKAVALSRKLRGPVVVSGFVLLELGNALSRASLRHIFISLIPHLKADHDVQIVPVSQELFERGLSLFSSRVDKEWSLIDCTSFVLMKEQRISDALTADHHFGQAGFNALLK